MEAHDRQNIFFIVNVDWFFLSHRLELAKKMNAQGYNVFILAKDSGKRDIVESHGLNFINIEFERSGKNPLNEVKTIFKIRKCLYKYRPIIVHNVTIKPAIYGSIASKIALTIPPHAVVNAISGLGYNFIDGRKGLVQRVLKIMMDFAFTSGVNFIFQNPDDQQLYKEFGYLKTNKHRIIKGAGVDHREYDYCAPKQKPRLEVVLTARMLLDKGIVEFIEAAKVLESKWKNKAVFKLIGDLDSENPSGIREEKLYSYLIPDYIVWEGYQNDIKGILENADIVCLPSYREGLPKSLIEAMAVGRPIVSTDVPGCRECVDHNYNGILVPARNSGMLADGLEKLLYDAELRLKMGLNSRTKMVNELSLDKVLNETLSFYEEVLI